MSKKESTAAQMAISFTRIAVIFALFGIGIIALMAEPADDSQWWWEQFFGSKLIAAVCLFLAGVTYKGWSKADKWIKAYDKRCDEALDAPNPMYIEKDSEQ